MSRSRAEFFRRARRWIIPAALLALTPKCLFCVAAYCGFAAALGFGGREICGPLADSPGPLTLWLVCIGISVSIAAGFVLLSLRRRKTSPTRTSPLSTKTQP